MKMFDDLKRFAPWVLAAVIMLAGIAIRLYDITDEPKEVNEARQFRFATIARGMYYADNPDIPEALSQFWDKQREVRGNFEPSILEYVTAQTYKLIGEEQLWVGRVYSIFIWALGGLGVFALARVMSSFAGGLAALSYYMLLPFGVLHSRVLMPDPMMVAAIVGAMWGIRHWEKHRTLGWAAFTGTLAGYAILVKSLAVILIGVPFAVYILAVMGLRKALRDRGVWLTLLLTLAPSLVYNALFFGGERAAAQLEWRFFPELWLDPSFYRGWLLNIDFGTNLLDTALAVLGLVLLTERKDKALLGGWWLGYIAYSMIFAYHTLTHPYYQLPYVPIVAVALAPVASRLAAAYNEAKRPAWNSALVGGTLVVIGFYTIWGVRVTLAKQDFRPEPEMWGAIAEILREEVHNDTMALTGDYGQSLTFHGNIVAKNWPRAGDISYGALVGIERTFEQRWAEVEGLRFFLVTEFEELEQQEALAAALNDFPIFAEGEGFVLYELMEGN